MLSTLNFDEIRTLESQCVQAILGNDTETVLALLPNLRNINFKFSLKGHALEAEGDITALHLAAYLGNNVLVSAILARDADPLVESGQTQSTALHVAVKNNQPETVALFMQHTAALRDAKNHYGTTPLHLAARSEDTSCLQKLLFAIVGDIRITYPLPAIPVTDNTNATPLFDAAGRGNFAAVKMLVECGFSPRDINRSGKTPIESAKDYPNIQEYLKEKSQLSLFEQCVRRLDALNLEGTSNGSDSAIQTLPEVVQDQAHTILTEFDRLRTQQVEWRKDQNTRSFPAFLRNSL